MAEPSETSSRHLEVTEVKLFDRSSFGIEL